MVSEIKLPPSKRFECDHCSVHPFMIVGSVVIEVVFEEYICGDDGVRVYLTPWPPLHTRRGEQIRQS